MEEKKRTGYPSVDKPWLKYYSEEAINAKLPECTIYEYLYENNKAHLNDTALLYFDGKTTYGQLFERIGQAAKAYRRAGVQRGDIVTLCTVTTPETVYSLYALNLLGAASNMVDPRTGEEGIVHYLAETHTKVLVVISAALPKTTAILDRTQVEKVIVVSPGDSMPLPVKLGYRLTQGRSDPKPPEDARYIAWKDFVGASWQDGPVAPTPYAKDAPAVIVHTGGTTGTPKGAIITDDNFNAMVVLQKYSRTRMERGHRFLDIMPPFIAYGLVCGISNPLNLGLQIIIIPKFNPAEFDKLILKHRPNHALGVPAYFESLTKSEHMRNADLSFIENFITGGDKIAPSTETLINDFLLAHHSKYKLHKGYGMTELSSTATYSVCDECNLPGSVGIPLFRNNIKIVNPGTQKELPYNELGEICMTSPTMVPGYYANEQATEETFITHGDGQRWIHTGDIGHMNGDGVLFIVDRMKRMIVRADGFKVYPSVIENTVTKHLAVAACAVVGAGEGAYSQGMVPKAFVVFKRDSGRQADEMLAEIKDLCRRELPEYAQPASYTVLDSLPLTPIGKIDYRALERLANP